MSVVYCTGAVSAAGYFERGLIDMYLPKPRGYLEYVTQ